MASRLKPTKRQGAESSDTPEFMRQRQGMIQKKVEEELKAQQEEESRPEFMKKLRSIKQKAQDKPKKDPNEGPSIEELDDGTDIPPWHRPGTTKPDWVEELIRLAIIKESQGGEDDDSEEETPNAFAQAAKALRKKRNTRPSVKRRSSVKRRQSSIKAKTSAPVIKDPTTLTLEEKKEQLQRLAREREEFDEQYQVEYYEEEIEEYSDEYEEYEEEEYEEEEYEEYSDDEYIECYEVFDYDEEYILPDDETKEIGVEEEVIEVDEEEVIEENCQVEEEVIEEEVMQGDDQEEEEVIEEFIHEDDQEEEEVIEEEVIQEDDQEEEEVIEEEVVEDELKEEIIGETGRLELEVDREASQLVGANKYAMQHQMSTGKVANKLGANNSAMQMSTGEVVKPTNELESKGFKQQQQPPDWKSKLKKVPSKIESNAAAAPEKDKQQPSWQSKLKKAPKPIAHTTTADELPSTAVESHVEPTWKSKLKKASKAAVPVTKSENLATESVGDGKVGHRPWSVKLKKSSEQPPNATRKPTEEGKPPDEASTKTVKTGPQQPWRAQLKKTPSSPPKAAEKQPSTQDEKLGRIENGDLKKASRSFSPTATGNDDKSTKSPVPAAHAIRTPVEQNPKPGMKNAALKKTPSRSLSPVATKNGQSTKSQEPSPHGTGKPDGEGKKPDWMKNTALRNRSLSPVAPRSDKSTGDTPAKEVTAKAPWLTQVKLKPASNKGQSD